MSAMGARLHTCENTRMNTVERSKVQRAWLVLVFTLIAYIPCTTYGSAAEQEPTPGYHATILDATPAFYDRTGNRLPFKYASYISQQKYLLLYFASNANAQSQKFTTELATWYLANGGGDNVEVILIGKALPADDPKTWMKDKDMPWLALAPDDASHANLTTKYGSTLMPTLVLLDENDEVIARSNDGDKNLGTRVVFKKYLELTKVPKKK